MTIPTSVAIFDEGAGRLLLLLIPRLVWFTC
jgi:hypothetical protein